MIMQSDFTIKKEGLLFFRKKLKIYWKEELLAEIKYNSEIQENEIEIFTRKTGESWKFPLKEFRDCLNKAEELLNG